MGGSFFSGVKQPSVQKAFRNQLWIVGTRRRQTRNRSKVGIQGKMGSWHEISQKSSIQTKWNWMEAKEKTGTSFAHKSLQCQRRIIPVSSSFSLRCDGRASFLPSLLFFLPPSFPPTEFIGLLFFLGWRETRSSRTDENGGRRRRRRPREGGGGAGSGAQININFPPSSSFPSIVGLLLLLPQFPFPPFLVRRSSISTRKRGRRKKENKLSFVFSEWTGETRRYGRRDSPKMPKNIGKCLVNILLFVDSLPKWEFGWFRWWDGFPLLLLWVLSSLLKIHGVALFRFSGKYGPFVRSSMARPPAPIGLLAVLLQ